VLTIAFGEESMEGTGSSIASFWGFVTWSCASEDVDGFEIVMSRESSRGRGIVESSRYIFTNSTFATAKSTALT